MVDGVGKILAWIHVLNVHKHTIGTDNCRDMITHQPRIGRGVLATIADEYAWRHSLVWASTVTGARGLRKIALQAHGPMAPSDVDRLTKLAMDAVALGETPTDSINQVIKTVLSSPQFLYQVAPAQQL